MKIAVIQLAYGEGSEESVTERAARAADLVRTAGAGHDLVMLPELWSAGGFAVRDWQERSQVLDGIPPALAPLAEAAREIGGVLHAGSVVERTEEPGPDGRHLWNTSVVLGPDGEQVATYRKVHRFGFGQGEPRLMEAGADLVVADLPSPADALTTGLSTCYDLRFPELYRILAVRGARVLAVPAAFTLATTREHWEVLLRARAIEDQAFVVAPNQVGEHAPGYRSGGRSMIVDPWGVVLAQAPDTETYVLAELDLERQAEIRRTLPSLANRRPAAYRWPSEVPA